MQEKYFLVTIILYLTFIDNNLYYTFRIIIFKMIFEILGDWSEALHR